LQFASCQQPVGRFAKTISLQFAYKFYQTSTISTSKIHHAPKTPSPNPYPILNRLRHSNRHPIPWRRQIKHFAVEQELVTASARAAIKNMDLHNLQGRRVALYVSTMGDQGSGTITGGRYSVSALLRGEYTNIPDTLTSYAYPNYTTTVSTTADTLSSNTQSTSVLNAPSHARSKTGGASSTSNIGLNINGQGDYRNETLITNPQDTTFLNSLIQTVFFLRGIEIVPAQYADTIMFINIDVFGTIRSRTELHLYNAETLKAQTKLEYFAIDRNSKALIIAPQSSSYEAQYQEQYALWMGPYKTQKSIKTADKLMVDFSDIQPYGNTSIETAPAAPTAPKGSLKASEASFNEAEPKIPLPAQQSNEIIRKRQEQS